MHNLFLGELRHHCREFWGIDIKDKSSDSQKVLPHTPAEQRSWLEAVKRHVQANAHNKLKNIRKGYIAAVAELNGAVPLAGFTKHDYILALLQWWQENKGEIRLPPVLQEDTHDFRLVRDANDVSKFRILDQKTLSSIRSDILATQLPGWMQRVPKNFGSPSHGKLKADQWRTGCLVNLVITLTRLWGRPSATPRQKILLDNFLNLVRAIDLATKRSMDEDRIAKFDNYMHHYLTGLCDTFKHPLVPNHHLSLHLRECLELFGPVHAWWAFPFERFNGIIQHLNTNSKSKDMPLTFMRYFYIGANLRWLIATTTWPDESAFTEMMETYNRTFRDAAQSNPRLASFRPFRTEVETPTFSEKEAVDLDRGIYRALLARVTALCGPVFSSIFDLSDRRRPLSNSVNCIKSFDHGGVKYATDRASLCNSFVTFTLPLDSTLPLPFPRAGRIKDIFLHRRIQDGRTVTEPFFVVDEYIPLTEQDATLDPYRKYEDLETRLFYNRVHATPHVLSLDDIAAHFASLVYTPEDIQRECVVVRSLDRVSTSLPFGCLTELTQN
ncbi:hypothetical protein C8T65DRAFT_577464 [Cerioporus squamosus]|nr:hypothetical protein C8T65DRAFT_577464 [Cerioporus squamosus]